MTYVALSNNAYMIYLLRQFESQKITLQRKMALIRGRLIVISTAFALLLVGIYHLRNSSARLTLTSTYGTSDLVDASWSDQFIKRAKDTKYGSGTAQLSFNDAVVKGEEWISSLPKKPSEKYQAQFTDFGQLEENGWVEQEGDRPDPQHVAGLVELSGPLEAIGVADKSAFQTRKEFFTALLWSQRLTSNE